jgi:hypothetical protein
VSAVTDSFSATRRREVLRVPTVDDFLSALDAAWILFAEEI